jgi:hypothetical protein
MDHFLEGFGIFYYCIWEFGDYNFGLYRKYLGMDFRATMRIIWLELK